MKKLFHSFTNPGDKEYNDSVFSQVLPLIPDENEYRITLSPLSDTFYWRFGLAMSREESFDFTPSEGRYANQDLRFIEIDVGERINGEWTYPGRLSLGSYYFPGIDTYIHREETYIPRSEVEVSFRADAKSNQIEVSVAAGGSAPFNAQFPFDDFQYIKIFAWADHSSYELDCHIAIRDIESKEKYEEPAEPSPGNNFWLLKLNTAAWEISSFTVGTVIQSGSHNSMIAFRVEYDLYSRIKVGDIILGYAVGAFESVVCTFSVEQPLHSDQKEGEIIRLRITKIFRPYIQVGAFLRQLPLFSRLKKGSPVQLLLLPRTAFAAMLSMDFDFPVAAITPPQREYMELIYRHWVENKGIHTAYAIPERWTEFPEDFDAGAINPLLMMNDRTITLWGISQIHPESPIFEKFDRVIRTIKGIFSKGGSLDLISSKQVLAVNGDMTDQDMLMIFQLMTYFPGFSKGYGRMNDGSMTLTMGEDRLFETYSKYDGLRNFMRDYLQGKGINITPTRPTDALGNTDDGSEPALFRTALSNRNRTSLSPVMGVDALAMDLANIIHRLPNEKGQMVGLFGRWGRGKTYLLEETWKELEKKKEEIEYIRITYDAWKFQETPASWAYLYELLVDKYLGDKKGFWNAISYYRRLFALNLKRVGLWPGLKFLAAILATIGSWFLPFSNYRITTIPLSIYLLLTLWKHLKKEFSTRAVDLAKKYSLRHSFKDSLGIQADIQAELIKLLKVWIPIPKDGSAHVKIILEVEDIDRCSSDKVISNIDALRIMLDDKAIAERMIILTAIDERILKSAICLKYESLESVKPKSKTPSGQVSLPELVKEYLDKLFIIAIKLGSLSDDQKDEFVSELLKDQLEMPAGLNADKSGNRDSPAAGAQTTPAPGRFNEVGTASAGGSGENVTGTDNLSVTGDEAGITPQKGYPAGSWQKLTEREHSAFKEMARGWKDATPRGLSIFLFRYLLCKNMLISRYEKVRRVNRWQSKNGVRDLLLLLKYYGDLHESETITDERHRISEFKGTEFEIELPFLESPIKISKTDYLILLEILEIVVAY